MSYQTQQTYRWPSPPAPCTSRKVTYDSPTSSISPLSARRQHEHAVPVGTVASRVKYLQKMQNAHTPRHLSPISRDHDHAGRATLGRRISHRFAEPASITSRPDEDPQLDYSHSYLGQRSSRTNHKEDHSFPDSNRPKDQTNSYGSQVGTHAALERAQQDTGNVRHMNDKRKMSEYNREMREYSQHEIDKIGEVHGSSTSHISPHPEPLRQAKKAPHGTASTKDTISTNRHESVRDLFKEYGISRPAGLVPSSEPTPDHSVLEDSNPIEDTNGSLPVSSQTPIADKFMYGKQNTESTSHVPLQSCNDEDNYDLQHTCRPSSTKKHVSKIPNASLEQKMARAEVARHQKAKEVHIRKKTLHMDYTPQITDQTRQDMSYAEGVSDHLRTPTKDNEHGHGHKHRRKKPSIEPIQKTSDPFKDHYPESAQQANSHFDVRNKLNLPEQLGSNELQDKQTQKHVGSASNHNTAPSEHHSGKSKIHQEKHTKHQGRKLAHQQHSQQHEASSRRSKQPKHNTAQPSHHRPLIETHAKPQRYDDTQRIQPHIAPSRIYSQATSQAPHEGMLGERSVSKHSMMVPKRANRSQYFTTPEQPIEIQHDFQMSKADEDSSILVSPNPILRVLPVEQAPRLDSPKNIIHQSHQREHRRSKSSSGVLSRGSPMSPCGSSSCRATHSGHKPYRHSISCTEKRHQKHEGDIDCTGTLSETTHADGQQRSPRKHQEDEQLPHGHSSRQDRESYSSRQEIVTTPQTFVIVEQCRNCSGFVDLCHHCPDICQEFGQNRRGVARPNEDERVSSNLHNLASRRIQANTSPIPAPLWSSNSSAHSRSWSRNSKPLSIASPAYPVTISTFSLPESSGEEYEALFRNKNPLKASAVTHSQNNASVKSKSPLNHMSKYPSIGGASGPIFSPTPKREILSPSWAQSPVAESAQATDAQELNISQESTTSTSKICRTQDQQDEALGSKSEPKAFPEHSDASSLIPVQSGSPIANQVPGDRQQLLQSDSNPQTSTQRQVESFTSTEKRKSDLAAKPPRPQSNAQPFEETAKEIRMPCLTPVVTKKTSYKKTESSDTDSSHANEAVRRFSQYVQTKANEAGKFAILPPETIDWSKRMASSPERRSKEYNDLTPSPNDSETEKSSDKKRHPEPGDTNLRTTGEIPIEQMEMVNKTYETASPEQLTRDAKPLPKRRSISSVEPSQQFDLQSVGQRETGSWLKNTGSSEQFVCDHRSLEKYQSTSNEEDSIVRRRMKQETRPLSPTTDDLLPRSKPVSTRSSSTEETYSDPIKESRSPSPAKKKPSPKQKSRSASPTKEKLSPKLEQELRSPSPTKERASPKSKQEVKSSSSAREQPSPKQISRSASPAKEDFSPKPKQESRSPSSTKEQLSPKGEQEVRSSISAKEKLSSKPTSRTSTAVYTVMDQPPSPETRLPTRKTLDPLQQFAIPPTSKLPVPKPRSASYHTVQSVPDYPFVKEGPGAPATPQVPQRRTVRPQLPSSRPQTSMERTYKGPLLATRSHTSLESYARTPSPGTPSIGAASTSISRPRTPAYKTTAKRLTPPDVRKEDKKSTSKSVQRRISAFFQIKEKKSIPALNQKLQQQLEEQKRKKSGDSNTEKGSESKRSKGLKMRNIDDRNKDRKISLKLRQPKESDPDTKQGAFKEDDTDSIAVQHSEGQGFDEAQTEPRVEHRLEDNVCEDEKHVEQPAEHQLEDDGEEIEGAPGLQDVGLESLSERHKGQDVESSMDYPSPIDETWTLRMVGYGTPENGQELKEIELSPPIPRQQSPQKPNHQGLVSSRVRDWDRELAILEGLSKIAERGTLRNNVPSGRKSKQDLQTSTDAYHTAKSRNQPPAQEEDCDQLLVESSAKINRTDDMHNTDDDQHNCFWKAMYISQREEGAKTSMGNRSLSKMRDSYADETEEASYEEKFGILGVTVVVHRRGREDLIVKTDLSDQ